MSSQNDSNGIMLACMALVGVGGLGISNTFGVPFLEAINILPKLAIWVFMAVAATYFGMLNAVWPLVLAFLFSCFIPILDYKAGVSNNDFPLVIDVAWYGQAGWQFLIFIAIVAIGYGIKYWLSRRY